MYSLNPVIFFLAVMCDDLLPLLLFFYHMLDRKTCSWRFCSLFNIFTIRIG